MTKKHKADADAVLFAFAKILDDYFAAPEADAVASPAGHAQQMLHLSEGEPEPAPVPAPVMNLPVPVNGPWDAIEVLKRMGINVQVEPDMYKKMVWLTQNVPQLSLQKIVKRALAAEVDRMVVAYYRPE